ncbi:MAG: hypothetical protein ACREFP_06955 [Acetobacteraceae bacterium]
MLHRGCVAAILAMLCAQGIAINAAAQAPAAQPQSADRGSFGGWSFSLAPYVWLPTVSSTINYTTPGGDTATTSVSAGIGDYISNINFALATAAEARYQRFSILTDVFYSNLSFTENDAHLKSITGPFGHVTIGRELQTHVWTRLATTIWTLAGGYTLAEGTWGNLDALIGLRLLAISATTNFSLTQSLLFANRTVALTRTGGFTTSPDYWDAIGGIHGRLNIPNSRLFVPYYFDVGTGGAPLTWQAFSGLGYQASWWNVSAGYRYLDFQNRSNAAVKNLSFGGFIMLASFHF